MNSADYKVNFRELKSRVGITDVALSLGYAVDRKAGVGRHVEMVLGSGAERRDTIIIGNLNDKGNQYFFRRNGEKGDVISFIRENLRSFNVTGNSDWHKIAKVMAQMANMPEPQYKDAEVIRNSTASPSLNASRYSIRTFNEGATVPKIITERGLSQETFNDFVPFLRSIQDLHNDKFKGYNIAFPYTNDNSESIIGYEIRGVNGFKSKAAGSANGGVWVADFTQGNKHVESNLYLFESAFDAMAFYQLNKGKLDVSSFVFVSVGGSFSDAQIQKLINRFPSGRPVDCFDNDLAGRVYALRLLGIYNNIDIKLHRSEAGIKVMWSDREILVPETLFHALPKAIADMTDFSRKIGTYTAPDGFKDWNDVLLGKRQYQSHTPSKAERDEALAQRRTMANKSLHI